VVDCNFSLNMILSWFEKECISVLVGSSVMGFVLILYLFNVLVIVINVVRCFIFT